MNNDLKKINLHIKGMHCASCEVLIEQKFKKIKGVEKVKVNHVKGQAEVWCTREPSLEEFSAPIASHGYVPEIERGASNSHGQENLNTPLDYVIIGALFPIILGLYLFLSKFNLIPASLGISDKMSYGFVFVIGLVAAVSTCMAVTGGLLMAVAAKYNELHPEVTGAQKIRPHLYFNAGRVVSYTLFGGLLGAAGSVFTVSPRVNGIITIVVSLVMIILGFQLLNLFPGLKKYQPRAPKWLAHKIHDWSGTESKGAPFLLGATTFFLPCGFTQALQLYVLSRGDAWSGALTMLAFSLGTLPALVSLGIVTSFTKGTFHKYFIKVIGVAIILIGLVNINNGMTLTGNALSLNWFTRNNTFNKVSGNKSDVDTVGGVQIAKMNVVGYEYIPSQFEVRVGVPVEWQINGSEAAGCARVIVVPQLGITEYLPTTGIKTIRFTPTEAGRITFSCSMGMTTPGAAFIVVPNIQVQQEIKLADNSNQPIGSIGLTADGVADVNAQVQKLNMEISQAGGFYPTEFTVKKNIPVELTIDTQVRLGGCMSTLVIPDYNIAHQLTFGTSVLKFTPTKSGTIPFTCAMGSRQGLFKVIN